jgi:transcriptional regulator with PAS, ATPase and Fis domain
MTIRALRFALKDGTPVRSAWSGAAGTLAASTSTGVYVVTPETSESLKAQPTLVNNRGRKHLARPLSSILLGQPRVPMVFAPFKSDRQVTRSIRTLLEHAQRRGERKAYVIGVPLMAYEQIAARIPADNDADADGAVRDASDIALLDPEEVPRSLEEKLVGHSLEMQVVRQLIVRAAREDEPVLVQGDTGTGKDLVARSIHLMNALRNRQPFVTVNCGAIPTELFESEVFGYVPGAFTSALARGSDGLWRSAKGGTIFLDEIGDLAPAHQVKILRALEARVIRPVGSAVEVAVEARVIAATNRDLYAMKESGEFREDLYYRLACMIIKLPALRDRSEDVVLLARRFWGDVAPRRPPLPEDVLRELATYRWNGNARELRYILANLHTTFPKSPPTVDRLRAVVRLRAPDADRSVGNATEAALKRMDRLRHLRQARSAIDACHRAAQQLSKAIVRKDSGPAAFAELGACQTELQLLGVRRDWFDGVATIEALYRVNGSLAALQALAGGEKRQIARFIGGDLKRALKAGASAVRKDEDRLLRTL